MVLPGWGVSVSPGSVGGPGASGVWVTWAQPLSLNLSVWNPGHQHPPCCLEERTKFSTSLLETGWEDAPVRTVGKEQPPGLLESVQKQVDRGGKLKLGGSSQDRMFPVYYYLALRAALVLHEVAETPVGSPPLSLVSRAREEAQGNQAFWGERGKSQESHREEPQILSLNPPHLCLKSTLRQKGEIDDDQNLGFLHCKSWIGLCALA